MPATTNDSTVYYKLYNTLQVGMVVLLSHLTK